MKKILIILLTVNFVLAWQAGPVAAVAPTTPATVDRPKANISEEKLTLIQSLGNRMANRMQAAIDRMKALTVRVESRIGKLKAQGKDVSKFTVWLSTISTNIGSAQTAVGKFRADLADLSGESDPKVALSKLKLDVKLVKDALTAVQTTMKQVVQSLRTT